MGQLYYGDNLQVMRDHLKDESVDLIYLDPPFNSKRDYNVLFKSPKGESAEAQITAFEDTWHWNMQAQGEFEELMHQGNTDVAELMRALRGFLGENDMMAYLTAMAIRLLEMHRVLKDTGSLYLHCDPTASHYLKVVLDGIFGVENMVNEIVWKRSDAHNDAKQGATHLGRIHDTIFFYSKTGAHYFKQLYKPLPDKTQEKWYRHVEEGTGRRYNKADVSGPGGAGKGNPHYEWNGIKDYWRYSKQRMQELEDAGRLVYSASGRVYQKRYLDESKGVAVQDFWDDIAMLRGITGDGERLGYPTQKPLALLERIIEQSSATGDVVLDPFCGCGTAVHAAQKLNRKWIGIDITHLAVSLIEKRMKDAFGSSAMFEVIGTPRDLEGARDLALRNRYQFQWWATSLVNAQPYQGKKKGSDGGIDGIKFFHDLDDDAPKKILVSVKSGKLKADDVRAFNHVREREKAEIGLFITLSKPSSKMVSDAATAGFYHSADRGEQKIPRIQILTIEDLLSGKARAEHPDKKPDMNFKKAKREVKKGQEKLF